MQISDRLLRSQIWCTSNAFSYNSPYICNFSAYYITFQHIILLYDAMKCRCLRKLHWSLTWSEICAILHTCEYVWIEEKQFTRSWCLPVHTSTFDVTQTKQSTFNFRDSIDNLARFFCWTWRLSRCSGLICFEYNAFVRWISKCWAENINQSNQHQIYKSYEN